MARSVRGLLGPLFLLAAVAALGWAGARELARAEAGHALRAAALWLVAGWLLLEAPLAARVSSDDRKGEDRGSMTWNALARGAALLAALLPARTPVVWPVALAGLLLLVGGFSFRLLAIRTLGRFYSHKVRRTEDHQVVGSGPYRVVRHPAYLGVIAAHLGFALVFAQPLALLAVALLVVPAFVHRIRIEEPMLMRIPGWADYARGRARLLPGLW